MRNLRARLPAPNSLVAFEAAARLASFTRAGHELGITREAVSRHIRLLEAHLKTKLFVRLHRAIELTEDGRQFAECVRNGLNDIADLADTITRRGGTPRVTVSATVAIASFWLTPRLPRFRTRNPEVEISVTVSDRPRDLVAEGIDVGLRYGDGRWPGLDARELFRTETYPVCAPGYLSDAHPLSTPSDLTRHVLLNLTGGDHAHENWRWWLAGHGIDQTGLSMLEFDNYANVIQAALDGQGMALGFSGIVTILLEQQKLVRPIPDAMSRGLAVYMVVPRKRTQSPSARAFCDWVVAEAAT